MSAHRFQSAATAAEAEAAPAMTAEIFTIPLDEGKFLIYAPLRRSAFVTNAAGARFVERLRAGNYAAGDDPGGALTGLLRALEMVDSRPETAPDIGCQGDPEPTSVTLLLTTACNLRCTYCYAAAGDSRARYMTLKTARRGIDFAVGNAVRRNEATVELGFHGGGEPTVHWGVLTAAFDYAKRQTDAHGKELKAGVATNGVLSEEQTAWILEHLHGASLSSDGLPAVHDACRVTAKGQGSSGQVERTMRRFDEKKFDYGVRLTVMAEHIAALPDSVEYLSREFHPRGIQVEPVYLLGRGSSAATAETESFIEAYREAAARTAARGIPLSFSGARAGTLTNHFCGASRDNFCLSADGSVTACYEAFSEADPLAGEFFYGRPENHGAGYEFDREKVAALRGQSVEKREPCRSCFARWSCGGDCLYKWKAAAKGGEFEASARCHVIRELTKDQILEKIAEGGGGFWHEKTGCSRCGGAEQEICGRPR